jgi:hypothetical protein
MRMQHNFAYSRRTWLALAISAAAGGRLAAADADFWNKKDPGDWTADEIGRLLTKSPWAKEASGIYESGTQGSSTGALGQIGQQVGVNGAGMGRGGRRGRGEAPAAAQPKGAVVWESAKPILEARKKPVPAAFKDHYVVGVSGIALPQMSDDQLFDQLKQFTSLQPNDQPPVQPGVAQKAEAGTNGVLLGFSFDAVELSADDKSIAFTTWLGHLVVKAKFDTKEMFYRGKVAL